MITHRSAIQFAAALGFLACASCAKSDSPSHDGGAGTVDASSVTADAAPKTKPATTCIELREQITTCGNDKACATAAQNAASGAAQTLYKPLEMCIKSACPNGDLTCRCETECQGFETCFTEAEECTSGNDDPFCIANCT